MAENRKSRSRNQITGKRRSSGKRSDSAGVRRTRSERVRRDPPVLSQNSSGVNAAVFDDRPIPRRRVDVPLSSTGAEIRLPSFPAIRNRTRLFSGILSAALLVSLILLLNSPLFQVSNLAIEGVQRFSQEEISRAASLRGKSIFFVDPQRVKKDLQLTYPGLTEIMVDVDWPAAVSIRIEERDPVMAWNHEGHLRWVDARGVAFEPHGSGKDIITVSSPVLPPTLEHRFVDPKLVEAVEFLGGYLPQDAELQYDPDHGLGWRDPRGWRVYFGRNAGNLSQKMLIYRAVTETMESKGIQPALISVEYADGPYIRMEQ